MTTNWVGWMLSAIVLLLLFVLGLILQNPVRLLITGKRAEGIVVGMARPFHLLPAVISHFRLNPFRFPILFVLSFAIPSCGLGTYLTYMRAHDLRSNGIKAVGYVIGSQRESSSLSDGSTASGVFPMITFKDAAGESHTIRRSLAKPLSRLKTGDTVEVIYLARHPDEGIVNTWDELWPVPLFFGLMMLAFLVAFRLVLSGTIRP